MYLCGMSILKIKAALEAEGILSPTGKNIWSKRTIDMILSNKKYCGFSIARSGKDPYLIENHHEPIITNEVFEQAQAAKAERTNTEIGKDGKKRRKNIKFTSQKDIVSMKTLNRHRSLCSTLNKHYEIYLQWKITETFNYYFAPAPQNNQMST